MFKGERFCSFNKTSSMNWVKNQTLHIHLQGKKKAFVALHFRRALLHAEIPQYCNNSE